MIKVVFNFLDYKAYLRHIERERRPFLKGFRSRLAESVGCNNAFISQVLNTNANFSLEQALKVSGLLSHNSDEEKYFLLLVEFARAGTPSLREHFKKSINELIEKHLNIKDRVKNEVALSPEAQATYYSQWYYAAIHMIVTIPELRKAPEMARTLRLKIETVKHVLSFLLSVRLVIEKSGEFLPGPSYLHLEKGSSNLTKHHTNWRMAAINSLQFENKEDIHYSTVSTLSRRDAEILRTRFVEYIQEYVQTLTNSSEETMYGFNLDFYRLTED